MCKEKAPNKNITSKEVISYIQNHYQE